MPRNLRGPRGLERVVELRRDRLRPVLAKPDPEPRPRNTSLRYSPSPAKPGGQSECDGIERRRFRRHRPNRHPREGGGPVRVRRTRTMPRCRLLLRVESCAASPRCRLGTSSGLDPRLRGGDGWARVASTVVFLDRQNAGLAPATPGGVPLPCLEIFAAPRGFAGVVGSGRDYSWCRATSGKTLPCSS
jgi:hypothetical protein